MNTGIQDAYHLGWLLALMSKNMINGEKFTDIYSKERRLVWTKVLNVAGGATSTMITKSSFITDFFKYYILPTLLKLPYLRRIMASTGSGEYIKFPQSPLSHQPRFGWIPGYNNVVGERFKILPLQKVGNDKKIQIQEILCGCYTFDILIYTKDLVGSKSDIKKFIDFMNDSDNVVNRARSSHQLSGPLTSIKIISPNTKKIAQVDESTPIQLFNTEEIYEDLENKMKDLLPITLTFSNAVFIVRPDGYIGKICSLSRPQEVFNYFEQILL
jgi:hypothetical protein